ncbi:MAG: hypothetical protein AB1488_00310 [Nitrospirota bacterium]
MPTQKQEKPKTTIIIGDSLRMKEMDDESVHLVKKLRNILISLNLSVVYSDTMDI